MLCQVLIDKKRKKLFTYSTQIFKYIYDIVGQNNFLHCLNKVLGPKLKNFVIDQIKDSLDTQGKKIKR